MSYYSSSNNQIITGCRNEFLFCNNIQWAKQRWLQAAHTAQCNSRRGEKKWKYSRISRPLHSRLLDFKSVNLQLGMLISSEMLIHHGRAHESTLTNDQMRPYFNLLLIPFQLLSSPAHISSFSITIRSQCNNHRLARTSSPCRGLKNKRFMSDPWKISNGESVCFHFL